FRVWSAGCSTGEEPYSIAFILYSQAEMLAGRERRILATDIDTDVLERAMRGVYTPDRARAVPMRFRGVPFLTRCADGMS
ncbi:CheR family methyltransferase, partial [Salmonella enterica subsp. enterica serovar 1,4,[5],12:i:-]